MGFVSLSKSSPAEWLQFLRAGRFFELSTDQSCLLLKHHNLNFWFAFYTEEPDHLAHSNLHLEKLLLKWFPNSYAGNYPCSCCYNAEWAVKTVQKTSLCWETAGLAFWIMNWATSVAWIQLCKFCLFVRCCYSVLEWLLQRNSLHSCYWKPLSGMLLKFHSKAHRCGG